MTERVRSEQFCLPTYEVYQRMLPRETAISRESCFLFLFSSLLCVELIEAHNNQLPEPKYKLGHNDFSDMTRDEYAQYNKLGEYGNGEFAKLSAENQLNPGATYATHRQLESVGLPDFVNWIYSGGVTPVKNQGKKI
jgi:hypothetical protein